MRKLIALIALLLLTGCDEEKQVVGIHQNGDGTVYLHTETSSKIGGAEVANFTGGTITERPNIIIDNDDGTVTIIYKDGREITAPRE